MVNMAKPCIGQEEKDAVCGVLDSGMIACGAVTSEFEREFSTYIGMPFGIATTSGTTALTVAIQALGLGKGDKILTTPFSFIASTNAIVYSGAVPVFADIDPRTFNVDPECLEERLAEEPDIKAVLIVHLFGQSCDMDRIMKIVKKHNLLLIEDCAQSHGAMWKGKKVGSFGDVSAFSFYPTKNMTTSEGGMVLAKDERVQERARLLINHGMKIRYHHDTLGYNYRMTNLAASIGLCQLRKLDGFNQTRRRNAEFYNQKIQNPLVELPYADEAGYHVYHQYTIKVKNQKRDAFVKWLEENEVGYGIFYPLSIPEQKCFEEMGFSREYPVTDTIKKEIVSIPIHPMLTAEELEIAADVINRFS